MVDHKTLTPVFARHLRETIGEAERRIQNDSFFRLYERARVRITPDLKWVLHDGISQDIAPRSFWWNL